MTTTKIQKEMLRGGEMKKFEISLPVHIYKGVYYSETEDEAIDKFNFDLDMWEQNNLEEQIKIKELPYKKGEEDL